MTGIHFLTVLDWGPRSGGQQIWFLVRTLFLALLMAVLSLCLPCTGREISGMSSHSFKDTSPYGPHPYGLL